MLLLLDLPHCQTIWPYLWQNYPPFIVPQHLRFLFEYHSIIFRVTATIIPHFLL